MTDEPEVLVRAREALQRVPPPSPELEPVLRRARTLRTRRALAGGVAAAVVAAGVLVPLGALGVLHGNHGPKPTPHVASPGVTPVLDFEAADGWNVVKSDPAIADQPGAPQAWAANVPFAPQDVPPGSTQGYPGGYPAGTVRTLPPEGIVIVADLLLETRNPLPPSRQFPERHLPLGLEQPPYSGWEGQPREDLSLSAVNATVNGWWVTVTVVFGTKDPSDALIRQANEEVARLVVPPTPPTTDAFDEFGIRERRVRGPVRAGHAPGHHPARGRLSDVRDQRRRHLAAPGAQPVLPVVLGVGPRVRPVGGVRDPGGLGGPAGPGQRRPGDARGGSPRHAAPPGARRQSRSGRIRVG